MNPLSHAASGGQPVVVLIKCNELISLLSSTGSALALSRDSVNRRIAHDAHPGRVQLCSVDPILMCGSLSVAHTSRIANMLELLQHAVHGLHCI